MYKSMNEWKGDKKDLTDVGLRASTSGPWSASRVLSIVPVRRPKHIVSFSLSPSDSVKIQTY